MKKQIIKLLENYENCCNLLVLEFCKKQDLKFEFWIGDIVGSIAVCNDYYFDMESILIDLKFNQPKDQIFSWYNDNMDSPLKSINYSSYIKGLRVSELI